MQKIGYYLSKYLIIKSDIMNIIKIIPTHLTPL
jgi:hypothetical protein